jgi:nitroreductase
MATTPKDVFEAIRTLLAVRSYQSTPVPDALIRRIVEPGVSRAAG